MSLGLWFYSDVLNSFSYPIKQGKQLRLPGYKIYVQVAKQPRLPGYKIYVRVAK